ncbi:MAG TPA: hypothetical protein VK558_02090 [Patescibacteria group bacterium]|nr:hypothetical protein [Patescibacteria group bacterium]
MVVKIPNRPFGLVQGLVDMLQRHLLQAVDGGIIFLAVNVGLDLFQQFDGAMQAIAFVLASIDRRVIVDVFAIVDRRFFNLPNRRADLLQGHVFMSADGGVARTMIDQPIGGAQIAQRMKVSRVLSR